ncbi:MAG TPA: hypothetical protein VK842_03870 [bacterium]|nr:hypothetical protein [bacterium]
MASVKTVVLSVVLGLGGLLILGLAMLGQYAASHALDPVHIPKVPGRAEAALFLNAQDLRRLGIYRLPAHQAVPMPGTIPVDQKVELSFVTQRPYAKVSQTVLFERGAPAISHAILRLIQFFADAKGPQRPDEVTSQVDIQPQGYHLEETSMQGRCFSAYFWAQSEGVDYSLLVENQPGCVNQAELAQLTDALLARCNAYAKSHH